MQFVKILVFSSLLCVNSIVIAQVIHFRLTKQNNIVIQGILNKQDTVHLMFHTGASDVTVTEDALLKAKTLSFNNTAESVQSWGGSNNASAYSRNNTLQIGGFNWSDITVWKDKYSGQETDGKCGPDLFAHKILELDFDKKQMIVAATMPEKTSQYSKFALQFRDGLMFLKAVCVVDSNNFENEFMVHSGYSGAILLADEFAAATKIGTLIKITGEKKLKDAFGNTVTTKNGILPRLSIGSFQLTDLPVGFFEGNMGIQSISIIGAEIVKRFNWIIDAERKFVYLQPNQNLTHQYLMQ
jgi:hypothetical protein